MNMIEDWTRTWWRFWSVRLAMLAAVAAAYITANPDDLRKLVELVPESYRPAASMLAGFMVFAVPTWTRLRQQTDLVSAQPTPPRPD